MPIMRGLSATIGSSVSMRNHASVRRFPDGAERRPMSLNLPLIALAVGAFGIGTTEFAPMGLLPVIADGVNVSIPSAGLLISAYALGVMIGAPIMTLLLARLRAKHALIALLSIFV